MCLSELFNCSERSKIGALTCLCIISFASSPDTQRQVVQRAAESEVELNRPFVAVDIVNRKILSDQQRKPSVTGNLQGRAGIVERSVLFH